MWTPVELFMKTGNVDELESALAPAASAVPRSIGEVEEALVLMNVAATQLLKVRAEERASVYAALSKASENVLHACAAQAPVEARRLDSGCRDFPDNVWRDVLAQLVDFHTNIFRDLQQYRDTEELSRLALNYGQALLQLIGWGRERDIEVPIRIAQEVFEGCCTRGDFDSLITILAFQLLGDSYRLRALRSHRQDVVHLASCRRRARPHQPPRVHRAQRHRSLKQLRQIAVRSALAELARSSPNAEINLNIRGEDLQWTLPKHPKRRWRKRAP